MSGQWFSPDTLRALGLALLHFLWQGAALAALLAVVRSMCRRSNLRYAVAVMALALMVVAPIATFVILRHPASAAPVQIIREQPTAETTTDLTIPPPASPPQVMSIELWLVQAWFVGVVLFSLRAAAGFVVLGRLRRYHAIPVSSQLEHVCRLLQRRLGIACAIRYCESRLLQVPAVVGWFRPMVLLPVSVITGLSPQQLETVIAHELAHIRRLDALVNVFQVAAETLLFYHPAVWWVSRRIRAEREHCCDDIAVSLCGGRLEYARALTLMEEWRSAPRFAMAASGSPLATRVLRLLGVPSSGGGLRVAGVFAAVLCLIVALGAGDALLGAGHTFASPEQAAVQPQSSIELKPGGPKTGVPGGVKGGVPGSVGGGVSGGVSRGAGSGVRGGVSTGIGGGVGGGFGSGVGSRAGEGQAQSSSGSYIDGLRSAGLTNFTVEQLITMKIQGVTPDFVHGLHEAGLQPNIEQLIAMRIHGATPQFARDIQGTGLKPGVEQLVAMRIHGVTAAYIRALQPVAIQNADPEFFIGARIIGITPELAEKLRSQGFKGLSLEKLRVLQGAFQKRAAEEMI